MQDINGHGVLVRQNDQVYCRRCGKTWDIIDPDPPRCKTGDDARHSHKTGDDARHSHNTGDDWIKEIRKMLYNSEK